MSFDNHSDQIVEHIINDLQPRLALVVGREDDSLIAALRQRGVEVWEEVKSSEVRVDASGTGYPPATRFDLVIFSDAFEDSSPKEVEQSLARLCKHTDILLVASTSIDMQSPEEWVVRLLPFGFVHDLDFDDFSITTHVMLFRRFHAPMDQVLAGYERKVSQLAQESILRRDLAVEHKKELSFKGNQLAILKQRMAEQESEHKFRIAEKESEIQYWKAARDHVQSDLDAIINSTSWRFMTRIQRLRERIIPIGSRREALMRSIFRLMSRVMRKSPGTNPPSRDTSQAIQIKTSPPVPASHGIPPVGVQIIQVDETVTSLPIAGDGSTQPFGALPDSGTSQAERILQGMRAHTSYDQERQDFIQRGQALFSGKRLLFVLPMAAAGGGANTIRLAARTMRRMGIDAQIYNLPSYRHGFEQSYPDNDVPMVYGTIEDLPNIATRYDAAVATSYITVYWLSPVASIKPNLNLGYYIQDYEPYFDEPGSEGYQKAAASYTLLPNLVCCCTTPWIYEEIQHQHSGDKQPLPVNVIGASFDTDLFMPRPRHDAEWPDRPLRLTAMIRPSTPRRSPRLTMELMQRASQEFGEDIELILFGADLHELQEAQMPLSFPFKLTGRLNQYQVANLMNEVDIFLDYSAFQGLGITALEAMACGAAVIVPSRGGTSVFARHEENCLVVDTQDREACFAALKRLVTEHDLRLKLQQNALLHAPQFYYELPTFRLLEALWPQNNGKQL